jgi:hypothetical protein
MRVATYRVITDNDEDSFGDPEDYETASRLAREAALDRPTETILITYKGYAIRQLFHTPDGRLMEEGLESPEEIDRRVIALTPSWVGKQQP